MQPTQDTSQPSPAQRRAQDGAKKWGLIAGGLIAVILVLVVVWLAWTAISDRNQEETPPAAVNITADGFSPATIVVKKGADVVWTNQDSQARNIAGDQEDLGLATPESLNQGESFSFVFDEAGTYTYHDPGKPEYKATVIVE